MTRSHLPKIAALMGGLLLVAAGSVRADGMVADSVREFSSTQGQEDWYYGYISGPSPSTFEKMENFGTSHANAWCYSDQDTELDCWLDSDGGLSASTGDGTDLWATRRWISRVEGRVKISGRLAKDKIGGGDGFYGRIYVDGREVYSKFISSTDFRGEDYSFFTKVRKNSRVDFAIDFNKNSDRDNAVFTAVIETAD